MHRASLGFLSHSLGNHPFSRGLAVSKDSFSYFLSLTHLDFSLFSVTHTSQAEFAPSLLTPLDRTVLAFSESLVLLRHSCGTGSLTPTPPGSHCPGQWHVAHVITELQTNTKEFDSWFRANYSSSLLTLLCKCEKLHWWSIQYLTWFSGLSVPTLCSKTITPWSTLH